MRDYTLYPFQEEAVPQVASRNFLLGDDCGLGKTLVAVESAKAHSAGPILVVTPKPVRGWWRQVITERDAGYVGVCGPSGRGIPWGKVVGGKPLLWVVVHPTAVRLGWQDMAKVHWDWIIVDEAHRFKNRKAKQTQALWRLPCRHKVMLTATPYGKDPSDLWALARWLYPAGPPEATPDQKKLFTSYWRWFETFVDAYQPRGRHYHIVNGPKNLTYLAQILEPFYLRRTKDEVLDLPPLTYRDVHVLLEGEQEALYRRLVKDAYAYVKDTEVVLENALVRMLRLQQVALDPSLVVDSWSDMPAKMEWVETWLDDHPDEPVVLVSKFRKFVEKWLTTWAGHDAALIVGGMDPEDIENELWLFEESGILVGSLQAVAEGLNLQRSATMIVMDGTYSPALAYQLAQRIHRIGQTHKCQIIHLQGVLSDGRGTVDGLVRMAQKKRWSHAQTLNAFVRHLREVE